MTVPGPVQPGGDRWHPEHGGQPFALVDAFTTGRPFSGNPAGVVLLEQFPEDDWMSGVADELHQAETAFLVPEGAPGVFALRWFTPVAEVALCGHATLASAHWLWESGVLDPGRSATFRTRSGELTATRDGDRVVLDFPAAPARELTASAQVVAALAGPVPVWTGITEHEEVGERNVLAVLDSADAVRALIPDLRAVEHLPAGGLIVTAEQAGHGVVSRYFAPSYGIPEDPVTGSAHCTIAPFWHDQLGPALVAEQASHRGGLLHTTLTDTGRVLLAGTARTSATGSLRTWTSHAGCAAVSRPATPEPRTSSGKSPSPDSRPR